MCNVCGSGSAVIGSGRNSVDCLCDIRDRGNQLLGGSTEIGNKIIDLCSIQIVIIGHFFKIVETFYNISVNKIQQTVGIAGKIFYSMIYIFCDSLNICNGILGLLCEYTDFFGYDCKAFSGLPGGTMNTILYAQRSGVETVVIGI